MLLLDFSIFLLVTATINALLSRRRLRRKIPSRFRTLPSPGGPFYFGPIYKIPLKYAFLKFKSWADELGPIYFHNLFGEQHIWISNEAIANELLLKRASKYSSRPEFHAVPDSKSWKYLPLLEEGETHARQRRFVIHAMSELRKTLYGSYPMTEAPPLLVALAKSPEDWSSHLEQYTSRIISRIAYGTPEHAKAIKDNAQLLLEGVTPTAKFVNLIPPLKRLPTWLSPWRMAEEKRSKAEYRMFLAFQQGVRDRIATQKADISMTQIFFELKDQHRFTSDVEGAFCVGMLATTAIFTIGAPLHTFFHAMALHPHWLKKLQQEIDHVNGSRLPHISDSPRMPTLRAVVRECFRWRPPIPTGIPHTATEDDVFDGYLIKKGTMIHPLEFAFTRNPQLYPEPEEFRPERWLESSYPTYKEPLTRYPTISAGNTAFGFGRRACLGQDLTEIETFTVMGAVAWAFNITKSRDSNGVELPIPLYNYSDLAITKTLQFPFDLAPRSEERRIQIEGFAKHGWDVGA